jgi:hypothetical protein
MASPQAVEEMHSGALVENQAACNPTLAVFDVAMDEAGCKN